MKKALTPTVRLTFYFLLVLLSLPISGLIADFALSRLCIAAAMLIPTGIERAVTRAPILGRHPLRGGGLAAALFPLFLSLLSMASLITSLLMTLFHIPITAPDFSFSLSTLLFVVLVTPVTEELFCRYVLRTLCRSISTASEGGVILATAILFSLMHANLVQLPYALLGGLVLGAAAAVSNSVVLPILLHIGINLFSLLTIRIEWLSILPHFLFPMALLLAALLLTPYGRRVCLPIKTALTDADGRGMLFRRLWQSPAPLCLLGSLLLTVFRML